MAPMNASTTCPPWGALMGELGAARRSAEASRLPAAAVCLTGQLRLWMITFPILARHFLLPLAAHRRLDFFWVGPADASYEHGLPWLRELPGLVHTVPYDTRVRVLDTRRKPAAELVASARGGQPSAVLHTKAYGCVLKDRLTSFLLQALQASTCASLVGLAPSDAPERAPHTGALPPQVPAASRRRAGGGAAGAGADSRASYSEVLRARADMAFLRPVPVRAVLDALGPTDVSALAPSCGSGRLGRPHDFALFGARDGMRAALRYLERLTPRTFDAKCERRLKTCSPGACTCARLGEVLRTPPPVGNVRGSVAERCYFLAQEYPEPDFLAQEYPEPEPDAPRSGDSGSVPWASAGGAAGLAHGRLSVGRLATQGGVPEAARVATECLGLREAAWRHYTSACADRGSKDGNFSVADTPWDGARGPRAAVLGVVR